MEDNNLLTEHVKEEISKCEDVESLRKEIIPMLKTQSALWKMKIQEIIQESGYTQTKFAELCGVSRVTVNKWLKGSIPRNRETFLKIGAAANYNRDDMDKLLQRYGKYQKLYSKLLEDCVYIYLLNRGDGQNTIEIQQYCSILGDIKGKINGENIELQEDIKTVLFDEKIMMLQDDDELESFLKENVSIFKKAYHKFYAEVQMHIAANCEFYSNNIYEMSLGQEWSSSLRQCVYAIQKNQWQPTRNKIISLGLHLSMEQDEINELLELAHMEPLCAKNIFESIIMFVLEDSKVCGKFDDESEDYDPDELCRYAREVLCELQLPEFEDFLLELREVEEDEW